MALSVSPTESPQRVSLENLPIEILTTIIEQALPKDIPNQYDVVIESCTGCLEALKFITPHTVRRPRSQMEHRYAILYINKKIHAEALRILRARTFRIKIRHRNLFVWDLRSTRSASDCLHMGSGAQVPVFPGLDLGKIRKLAIEIAPADFQSIWYHARNALSALCERQLFPRGPIKRLYFLIEDMTRSKEDPLDPFFLFFPRITPAFEDYENVLQSCEQVVPAADQCEIRLPYWMERHEAKDRLVEKWGKLGASIVFMPAPFLCLSGEQEEFVRRLEELAPLAKGLLVSQGTGAV